MCSLRGLWSGLGTAFLRWHGAWSRQHQPGHQRIPRMVQMACRSHTCIQEAAWTASSLAGSSRTNMWELLKRWCRHSPGRQCPAAGLQPRQGRACTKGSDAELPTTDRAQLFPFAGATLVSCHGCFPGRSLCPAGWGRAPCQHSSGAAPAGLPRGVSGAPGPHYISGGARPMPPEASRGRASP